VKFPTEQGVGGTRGWRKHRRLGTGERMLLDDPGLEGKLYLDD